MAQESAMDRLSEQEMPRVTSFSSGTLAYRARMKAVNSLGSMEPAVSQTVTVFAPASMAARTASYRKVVSLRVASSAMNSTSAQYLRHSARVSRMEVSMASGFLWKRYSICTGLTGAHTCSRAFFASFRAFQVAATLSAFSATGTARMLSFTAAAMDLIRRASILGWAMGSSSMTETPSLSSSLLSSIFSLKEREISLPVCFMVTSLIRIWFIALAPYSYGIVYRILVYRILEMYA